jgi:hypothetical protein
MLVKSEFFYCLELNTLHIIIIIIDSGSSNSDLFMWIVRALYIKFVEHNLKDSHLAMFVVYLFIKVLFLGC